MKFQHTTALAIQPGTVKTSSIATASGLSLTVIPGQDATFTVAIQQLLFTWTGLTAAGLISVSNIPSDPSPFTIYQSLANDTIVVPFYNVIYQLGTYGLRAQNNATGGYYNISAFYTTILN